jgi:hypothetical protein
MQSYKAFLADIVIIYDKILTLKNQLDKKVGHPCLLYTRSLSDFRLGKWQLTVYAL